MKLNINYYWQELNRKYSSNQVFLILTYWTLTVYALAARRESGPQKLKDWRECLLSSCRDFLDYDVNEAAVQLSDRIEWSLLEKDETTEKILSSYESKVRAFFQGGIEKEDVVQHDMQERLQRLMYELFDLASVNTSYQTTPWCISNTIGILFLLNDINQVKNIYCGNAMLGLATWKYLRNCESISYYEMNAEPVMCEIDCLMTHMCGIPNSKVVCEDFSESQTEQKFDLVLMDVPRGKNKKISVMKHGEWIDKVNQKNVFTDWIYLLKVLECIDEKGKGIVIVTSGSLTRKNESMIRKKIIGYDWIEAIITLPVNLYPNTRTGSEIIIFNKCKEQKRKKKIIFIDISQYYYRDNRNYYSISEEGTNLLLQAYEQYCEIPQVSSIVSITEIEDDAWSLKPLRYFERKSEKQSETVLFLKDIANITRGVQLKKEEEETLSREGTALLLNIKDIQNGEIHYECASKISPKNNEWHNKFQIQENDIIITSKGTNFKIAIVGENPPEAYVSGNLTIIRVVQSKYHPHVLLEYLLSEKGMRTLESIQSGTTIRMLNNANLEKLEIPDYEWKTMNLVGERLKNERRKYIQETKRLTERYHAERKALLEMIKISE